MARTRINALVTERALRFKSIRENSDLADMIANDPDEAERFQLKNVCAKLSGQLSDEIDQVVGLLDISKRRFIESALVDALREAHRIIDEEGMLDDLDDGVSAQAVEG